MKRKPRISRAALQRPGGAFLGTWVPAALALRIDSAAVKEDLDRSRFLRRALEEKLAAPADPRSTKNIL